MTFGLEGAEPESLAMKVAATEILMQFSFHDATLLYPLLTPDSKLTSHLKHLFTAMRAGAKMPAVGLIDRAFEMVGNVCVDGDVREFVERETGLRETVI